MLVSIIVAVSENQVIGKNNQLPWHLPADLKYFKKLTTGHHMIMGRKTFESIGKALPNRISIIITRNTAYPVPEGCILVHSLEEAIKAVKSDNEVFIIGGAEVIKKALDRAHRIYLTEIHAVIEGDTFLAPLDQSVWKEVSRTSFKA